MSMLLILVPLSLALVLLAVWAFFWAVDSGQFDDLETPAWDVLVDDESPIQLTTPGEAAATAGQIPVAQEASCPEK